jgi:hypothetical protein
MAAQIAATRCPPQAHRRDRTLSDMTQDKYGLKQSALFGSVIVDVFANAASGN